MKFITAEQFLGADKKVQDAIYSWWKPSEGDLVDNGSCEIQVIKGIYEPMSVFETDKEKVVNAIKQRDIFECGYIPLLTVEQLIEFIEWKTNTTVDMVRDYELNGKERFMIQNYSKDLKTLENGVTEFIEEYKSDGHDILNALWQIIQEVVGK